MKRGLVLLLVVAMAAGFYGWRWNLGAERLAQEVHGQLEFLSRQLIERRIQLTWERRAAGFPSSPRIELIPLTASYETMGRRMELILPLEIREDAPGNFRILPKPGAEAVLTEGGAERRYRLALEPVPTIVARTRAAQKAEGKTPFAGFGGGGGPANIPETYVSHYAMQLSDPLLLHIEEGGKMRTAEFHPPHLEFKLWRPMNYDLSGPLEIFFYMLEEAERTPTK